LDSPSVAAVILNWNGKKYLEQFLPSLVHSTYSNLRIMVADNASTDDSVEFLEKNYPQIKVIQNHGNLGFTGGYNEALKQVDASYYVLLNSDVEVTPGWVEPAVTLLEKDLSIGACQPKMLDWMNRHMFEYAGAAGGWLDAFGYPFCRGRVFDYCEEDNGQYDQAEPIFWASGAALFIRAKVFHEMGGCEPFFFAHMEEIDLCWRMQLAGYKIYSCPQSVVYHVGGGTLPKGDQRKVFLNFRNNLIMLTKNMRTTELFWKIPIRIMLDAASAWKNIFIGEPAYFLAVTKAHMAYAKWLFIGRSKSIFPVKRNKTLTGLYHGNIAWQHFIKGKKGFREIVRPKN
jgi:GT2 family glycosyltransferase